MTDPNLNILEQLEREWRDLCSGIRQEKLEELFMQATAVATQTSYALTEAERAAADDAARPVEHRRNRAEVPPSPWRDS